MVQVRDSTVDVMRLSIIVRNNLEKDADGQEYHAASSNGATSGDVKLNHTDAELDFEEQATDAAGELPGHQQHLHQCSDIGRYRHRPRHHAKQCTE